MKSSLNHNLFPRLKLTETNTQIIREKPTYNTYTMLQQHRWFLCCLTRPVGRHSLKTQDVTILCCNLDSITFRYQILLKPSLKSVEIYRFKRVPYALHICNLLSAPLICRYHHYLHHRLSIVFFSLVLLKHLELLKEEWL